MAETTDRFQLPFILPGQAQKELFHNEALAMADALLHPAVEGAPLAAPPEAPAAGQMWIVGANPGGAWSGRADMLAAWTQGGWRFAVPAPGMAVWNKSAALWAQWTGTSWKSGEVPAARIVVDGVQVVGSRQQAVPSPSGGTIIDAEARSAIASIIVALKTHGLTD